MNLKGDVWQGIVRRRALTQALKQEQDMGAAVLPPAPPPSTAQDRLAQDLTKLQGKTQRHLQPPARPGRVVMGKMKLFFLFLLFLLAGFLFFVAGFLTCYTVFPPRPVSVEVPQGISQQPYGVHSSSQGLAAPSGALVNTQTSYARRQAMLRGGEPVDLIEQAENRTKYTASVQARNAVGRVLNRISMGLRSSLGPYLGATVAPLTTGLARSAVEQALPLNQGPARPGSGLFSKQGAGPGAQNSSSQEPSAQERAPSSGVSTPGNYTILVQECPTSEESLALSDALRGQGFGAYVVKEQTPSGRVNFVVKAGQFSSFQEARDAAALLGRQWQRPTRVVLSRPLT